MVVLAACFNVMLINSLYLKNKQQPQHLGLTEFELTFTPSVQEVEAGGSL